MRLKISAKEGLLKINQIVAEAAELLDSVKTEYWKEYEDELQREKNEEKAMEKEEEEKNEELKNIEEAIKNTKDPIKNAALQMRGLQLRELQLRASTSVFTIKNLSDEINVIDEKVLGKLWDKYQKWENDTKGKLSNIFLDYVPIHSFSHAFKENTADVKGTHGDFLRLVTDFDAKMDKLVDFYNYLNQFVRSPLAYIPDKGQIWFYDVMIQLKKPSNQTELCQFMFNFSIGEWKEFADTYDGMFGSGMLEEDKDWKTKVVNAANDINRKTKKQFGFSIFEMQRKSLISINLPSRIISSFT